MNNRPGTCGFQGHGGTSANLGSSPCAGAEHQDRRTLLRHHLRTTSKESRVDAGDLDLRNLTYAKVVELGRVPAAAEVAAATGREPAEVVAGWRRLDRQHALVLNAATDEIRM